MLLFAHTGIALGAGAIVAGVIHRHQENTTWFAALTRYVDIRVFMIGSILPDLIDKPVGQYLFRDTFHNGRIFSHSLLFLLVLAVIGLVLFKTKRQVWMLTLAAGTLIHLVLDEMWYMPGTLFWPLSGWKFNQIEFVDLVQRTLNSLINNPEIYITEALGLAVLLWFGLVVIFKKKADALIKTGRIS